MPRDLRAATAKQSLESSVVPKLSAMLPDKIQDSAQILARRLSQTAT
jgi:hypothetical protein